MKWYSAMMLGRLASGEQADHGGLVHAVWTAKVKRRPCPFNDFGRKKGPDFDFMDAEVSLCGRRPGKRSVGWSTSDRDKPVDCPKCQARIERELAKNSKPTIHIVLSTEYHETDDEGQTDSTVKIVKAYRKKERADGYVKDQIDRVKHPENSHTSFDIQSVELE